VTLFVIISLCAFLVSFLTLYSGFGLSTLLMPVIAIFFPVPIAIAITAFVHLMNNIFKLILLRKTIQWPVALKFGFPAVLAAIPGAWLLTYLSDLPPVTSYYFFHILAIVEPIKIVVGVLLIIFATLEWRAIGQSAFFTAKWLPVGGLISGFFGGLSGQQGAFRTPFLLHSGLNKEQFIATNASIAVLVDGTRLLIYGVTFHSLWGDQLTPAFLFAIVCAAFLGSMVGIVGLKKIRFSFIQHLVIILLYFLGTLILLGII